MVHSRQILYGGSFVNEWALRSAPRYRTARSRSNPHALTGPR